MIGGPAMRTERVQFQSDGRRLSGFLDLPRSAEPHPAVVLVHGSGPTDLEQEPRYVVIREAFTGAGLACLMWDKPGCGRSEGERRQVQSHSERAREVIGAIDMLKCRSDVDPRRIGLWGISEGVWISTLVLRRQNDVAWAILVSGPSSTLAHAAEYIARTNLQLEGHSREEIDHYLKTIQHFLMLLRTGEAFDAFLEASRPLRGNSLFQLTGWSQIDRSDWEDPTARENLSTDTRELLTAVNCPVLAVFGERDTQVDWRTSMAVYQDVLRQTGNADVTIQCFAGANHNMRECNTGSVRETRDGEQGGYVLGFIETMMEWLKRRGFAGNPRSLPGHRTHHS